MVAVEGGHEATTAPLWEDDARSADLSGQRRRRRELQLRRTGYKLLGVLALLAIWELAALIVSDATTLPSVQATVSTFFHYFNRPYPASSEPLWLDLLISARRIVIGFLAAVVVGVLAGAAMWSARPLRHMIDPVIELTRPLPPLAFIPLLIVWFGIGELPKILLIFIGVTPIIIVSTVAALDSVPPEFEQCARALGASRLRTLFTVQVRAAIPGIITGMRLSMGYAWASIVAAEMIAGTSGIGYLILQAGNYLQTSLVMAGIISIGIVGVLFDAALRLLLRLADPSRAVSG